MTCTATGLRDEIKRRFNVSVKYVVFTHGHADHISGGQIFQNDGALVVANQRALEPIIGEKMPTAVPNRVFDKDMTITLGGETVLLHRVAPSHSDSMIMVLFPGYRALQCTDVCENKSMPYNDFLDFYYDGWIETLDWVAQQDFDVIDVGHRRGGPADGVCRTYARRRSDRTVILVSRFCCAMERPYYSVSWPMPLRSGPRSPANIIWFRPTSRRSPRHGTPTPRPRATSSPAAAMPRPTWRPWRAGPGFLPRRCIV
jgi:glyoxylase-like metal-dependent hydrolase (beta-lactamase superfamily II)